MKQRTHLLLASLLVSLLAGLTAIANETPGGRTGRLIFDARYIADTGSYLTNDTCHVALTKTANIIPDDTEVLVYARPVVSTNASDWVQLLPLRTIAEHPADYYLANAISNDVMVTANYVPPSPVITNFLFTTACKICLGITPTTSLPLVVPHAKAIAIDSFDSRVEYLESTGTQYIKTGFTITDTTSYNGRIMPTALPFNSAMFGYRFVNSATAYGNMRFCFIYSDGRIGLRNGLDVQNSTMAVVVGSLYNIEVDNQSVRLNDSVWINADNKKVGMTPPGEAWLFSVNCTGYYNLDVEHPVCMRLYSWQIFDNGVLVRDFIPVRVGNIGYMFDAVSGKLFGNAGTGNFILGPDL